MTTEKDELEPIVAIKRRLTHYTAEMHVDSTADSDLPMAKMLEILRDISEHFIDATSRAGDENNEIKQRLAVIEANSNNMQRDMASISKLVRDGNGQPSIVQRLSTVETILKNQSKEIEQLAVNSNAIIAAKYMTRSQIAAGLIGMIITALLSALSLVAALWKP
jgi:hypothetical protein